MKFEHEKIILSPLNLSQVKMAGVIIGSLNKNAFKLKPIHLDYLPLMQKGLSVFEISQHFLNQGQLISFSELRELLIFLVSEGLVQNPKINDYFQQQIFSEEAEPGFFERLLGIEKPQETTLEKILGVPFFRSLPKEVVTLFMQNMRVIETPAKVKVCEWSQMNRSMFCLLEGGASVFKKNSEGKNQKVADLTPGCVFGEVGFFLGKHRTADVVTNQKSLIAKFKYVPEIYDNLIRKDVAQMLQNRFWLIHAMLGSSMFQETPEDCFDALIHAGKIKPFKAGSEIVTEGRLAESFFIVVQGNLEVSQNRKKIRELKQGDCFGEVSLLLNRGIRTASVKALGSVLLLEIPTQSFYNLLSENLFLACEFEQLSISRILADYKRQA